MVMYCCVADCCFFDHLLYLLSMLGHFDKTYEDKISENFQMSACSEPEIQRLLCCNL